MSSKKSSEKIQFKSFLGPKSSPPLYLQRLFRLVGQLQPDELRYIKRSIRQYSDQNNTEAQYVRLLDMLYKVYKTLEAEVNKGLAPDQAVPVSEILLHQTFEAQLKEKKIFEKKDLRRHAIYLYKVVLRCMRSYNFNNKKKEPLKMRELLQGMLDLQFLYRRGLFADSLPLLQDLKSKAESLDALPYQYELLRLEQMMLGSAQLGATIERIRGVSAKKQAITNRMVATSNMTDLYIEAKMLGKTAIKVDEDMNIRQQVNGVLSELTKTEQAENDNFEYQLAKQGALAELCNLLPTSDFLRSALAPLDRSYRLTAYKNIVALFEKFKLQQEDYDRYRKFVVNYLCIAVADGNVPLPEKYENIIAEIKPWETEYLPSKVYFFLMYYLRLRDFKKGIDFIAKENILDRMAENKGHLSAGRRQVMLYTAGVLCFVASDYEQAEKLFNANLLLKKEESPLYATVEASALYRLLAKFELGKINQENYSRDFTPLEHILSEQGSVSENDTFRKKLLVCLLEILKTKNNPYQLEHYASDIIDSLVLPYQEDASLSHLGLFLAWLEHKQKARPISNFVEAYL